MKLNFNLEKFLVLMPGTFIVKGVKRAVIINIARDTFDIIPLELTNILQMAQGRSLTALFSEFDEQDRDTLNSYIHLVISGAYGILSDVNDHLISNKHEMYTTWDSPFRFTNAIIDYHQNLDRYFRVSITQLAASACNTLQVRFFSETQFSIIEDLVNYIHLSQAFEGLSIIVDYNLFNRTEQEIESFVLKYPVVNEIILYSAPSGKYLENKKCRFKMLFIQDKLQVKSCGAILPLYFSTNIESYTESINHNSCLNRKIAIDEEGYIKNCPSMKESFGNIKDTALEEAVNKLDFKRYWNIKKDEITKCKDCEFRHLCTDCRAYLEDPDDIYSAPLKCGYDPYTCKWEEWSDNPLKQKAIDYYGMKDIVNSYNQTNEK